MKLYNLKRSKRGNSYCGPAALSFVLGIDTDAAAAAIRNFTGQRQVIGTSKLAMKLVLRWHGINMCASYIPGSPMTLAAWLKASVADRTAGRMFLIVAGSHWQLVTGRRYACGRIGEIVSIKDKRVKRRAQVEMVYELVKW